MITYRDYKVSMWYKQYCNSLPTGLNSDFTDNCKRCWQNSRCENHLRFGVIVQCFVRSDRNCMPRSILIPEWFFIELWTFFYWNSMNYVFTGYRYRTQNRKYQSVDTASNEGLGYWYQPNATYVLFNDIAKAGLQQ